MFIDYGTMFSAEKYNRTPYSREDDGADSANVPEDLPASESQQSNPEVEETNSESSEGDAAGCAAYSSSDPNAGTDNKEISKEVYAIYLSRHSDEARAKPTKNYETFEASLEKLEDVAKNGKVSKKSDKNQRKPNQSTKKKKKRNALSKNIKLKREKSIIAGIQKLEDNFIIVWLINARLLFFIFV